MFITIDDLSVEIIRKSIKNVNLRIYPPSGQVKLSVPLRYPERLIHQLLQDKMIWIRKKQELIRSRDYHLDSVLTTGSTIQFLGQSFLLIIEEHEGPSVIQIKDHLIFFYTKPGASSLQINTAFNNWYKREMSNLLPKLIQKWEPVLSVEVAQWGIRQMKTRWGSCNTRDKRIWLSLKLIHKPLVCLEYVLVHEMVHLLEASHNKRFYDLMSRFMPEWKAHQMLLENVTQSQKN
ncbi:M48 family metallopeptidase [Legionella waltersii]|uniref:Zinc metalloprotease n=1 Tax=Legionella waltersii TaxID=66969 RepID=A0A0W1A2D5_9GAMM|nr:SprT family zinc-dependent metalloprotease [Legionella waltersii]KTD75503.1 zinc metalloprotease [Legionella waltersii]SNU98370.1 metal-dependent hydrolase [Legionella waltersii]